MSKKPPKQKNGDEEADRLVRKSAEKLGLLPRQQPDKLGEKTLFDEFAPLDAEQAKSIDIEETLSRVRTH